MLTHDFKVSTHEDNRKSKIEVSTHDTEVSTHMDKGTSWEILMIKSRNIVSKYRHMETVRFNYRMKT